MCIRDRLKTAFQIGFMLFIPFLIIDLVVASVLMAMGMMMLSPMMISFPLKLMLFVLDVFFTFNIALSLVILLATVYSERPLDFAVFPTVLLVSTLLRLALNVASTRVVLLNGHAGGDAAGKVIEAFGHFVVGGNFAVGLVAVSYTHLDVYKRQPTCWAAI